MFSPADPFPVLHTSYAEEVGHSQAVDDWLGLKIKETEATLEPINDGHKRWENLGPNTFLTPYSELRRMLEILKPQPGDTIIDLGAGYGRLGFVLHRHFPEVYFLGYELVEARVREGNRALKNFDASPNLYTQDLADPSFSPEPAQIYFIYDFGSRSAVAKTLKDLQAIARQQPILVVGRGREVRDQIERNQPWLGGVVPPEHHGNFSLYRSEPAAILPADDGPNNPR